MYYSVQTLIDIIEGASKIVLEVYNSPDFDVQLKSDNSPLTRADLLSSNYICENLKKYYPLIPIICEETKNETYEKRQSYEYYWLIDPIDGTKEFIKRNGEFTVNIALCCKNQPIAGFVSIPTEKKIYYGIKNRGSFLFHNGETKRLHANKKNYNDKNQHFTIIASRSHSNKETEDFINEYPNHTLTSVGSSIKLLWIAEGKADLYPRIAPTMEWDTAASHIIVEEAGGTVLQYNTTIPLSYNKPNLLNPYFVCKGGIVLPPFDPLS